MDHPPSQESDTSVPDSFFSNLGEVSENSGPYQSHIFAESGGSSLAPLAEVAPPGLDQPPFDRDELPPFFYLVPPLTGPDAASMPPTAVSHGEKPHMGKPSEVNPVGSSFHIVSDVTAVSTAQVNEPASTPPLYSSRSRPSEPPDDNARLIHRPSRFSIRQRLGRVFDPILHQPDAHK